MWWWVINSCAEGSAALTPLGGRAVVGSGVRSYSVTMLRKLDTNRLLAVDNELRTLKDTVRELESDLRLLQVEWEETLRKITNTLRSLSRSGGKKLPQEIEINPAAGVPLGADQISEAIHARRNRAVPHPNTEAHG